MSRGEITTTTWIATRATSAFYSSDEEIDAEIQPESGDNSSNFLRLDCHPSSQNSSQCENPSQSDVIVSVGTM